MTQQEKEMFYQEHVAREDSRGIHVDGCFYCGGAHPSDTCRSSERDEWWRDEREAIR